MKTGCGPKKKKTQSISFWSQTCENWPLLPKISYLSAVTITIRDMKRFKFRFKCGKTERFREFMSNMTSTTCSDRQRLHTLLVLSGSETVSASSFRAEKGSL